MKEIEKKINEIDNLSDSQRDKLDQRALIQDDLIDFLGNQIRKLDSKNSLKEKVNKALSSRIEPEDEEEPPMTTSQLLKLFEILSKDDNDAISNILDVIKKDNGIIINVGEETKKSKNEESLSKEEIDAAKSILNVADVVKKLRNSESSIEELEK